MCGVTTGPIAHSPQCIYRTALFLAYVACRGMIDGDPHPKAAATAKRISNIFKEDWVHGLTLDPPEQRFIDAPFGRLQQSQRIEASWLIENMAVLAWAVKAAELPPYYQKVDGAAVGRVLGVFQAGHTDRIAEATLREPNEIIAGAQVYATLYWRFTTYRKDHAAVDFQAKLTAPEGHLLVDGLEFIDRDLAVEGKPLGEMTEEEVQNVSGIVHQRYQEFRFLLGVERSGSRITALN